MFWLHTRFSLPKILFIRKNSGWNWQSSLKSVEFSWELDAGILGIQKNPSFLSQLRCFWGNSSPREPLWLNFVVGAQNSAPKSALEMVWDGAGLLWPLHGFGEFEGNNAAALKAVLMDSWLPVEFCGTQAWIWGQCEPIGSSRDCCCCCSRANPTDLIPLNPNNSSPSMGRDNSHSPRLLQFLSSLTLDIPRMDNSSRETSWTNPWESAPRMPPGFPWGCHCLSMEPTTP